MEAMKIKIKILLADDHTIVRKGLSLFLRTLPDFEIVGEAQNGKEVLDKIPDLKPDVVLMDLSMPEMDGIEATSLIKQQYPEIKVLVLTSFSDQDHVLPALTAGAAGYILKEVEPDQLAEAIRSAYKGLTQLHPDITNALISGDINQPSVTANTEQMARGSWESLTAREKEVLGLVSQGMSNKQIADTLVIAEKTVKTHIRNILSKLNLTDRTQAAVFAVKQALKR